MGFPFDPYLGSAAVYLVVCAAYLRKRHTERARYVLAVAAALLALFALMHSEIWLQLSQRWADSGIGENHVKLDIADMKGRA